MAANLLTQHRSLMYATEKFLNPSIISFLHFPPPQKKNFNINNVMNRKVSRQSKYSRNAGDACPVSAEGVGGNSKTGKRDYNVEPLCLPVLDVGGGNCSMTGTYVNTIDNENTRDLDRRTPVEFVCATGFFDAINGAFGVCNDAHYHAELVLRMLKVKFNIDWYSVKPRIITHFDELKVAAFVYGPDIIIGDGSADKYFPLSNLDFMGYNFGVMITAAESGLIQEKMSGGVLAAFSDILGIVAKSFHLSSQDPPWSIAEDIMKEGTALRYFDDPTKEDKGIKNVWRYRSSMRIFETAGIFDYAFYQMVKEEGLDMYDMFKNFYDANKNIWKEDTNFFDGACGVVQAAYDNSHDWRKVRTCFRRTWIPLILCRASALTTTMFVGESRQDILVSRSRSPIIRVEMDYAFSVFVQISTKAPSNSDVLITVFRDDEANDVIQRGRNKILIGKWHKVVYVQLSSDVTSDMAVTLSING